MESENYEKIITVNDLSYESIRHCTNILLHFMYNENSNRNVEYFRLRLKDSEKSPLSKDLLLQWCCHKQLERLSPEDACSKVYTRSNDGVYEPLEACICDSPTPVNK